MTKRFMPPSIVQRRTSSPTQGQLHYPNAMWCAPALANVKRVNWINGG
jgi:hypothetical protein